MKHVVWFEDVGKEDVSLVGGKGANLGELVSFGINVPPGFIVTSDAYSCFLEAAGISEKIFGLLDGLDVEDTEKLRSVSEEIKSTILEAALPSDVENSIKEAYWRLGAEWVAVRSSATAEDLPEASFAGQQETFLFVKGDTSVVEHVRKCWASLFTPRAIYYRVKHGFDHRSVGIAVVVQKMVRSEVSGVMFTAHPATGDRNKIVIEAALGLGESVVSGGVTPDEYVVDKKSMKIVEKKINVQKRMVIMRPEGGTEWVDVPADLSSKQKLSDSKILELASLGKKIEDHYGKPQDIEWAMESGVLYVVQARPITALGGAAEEHRIDADPVLRGTPASPGVAVGNVRKVLNLEDLSLVKKGDVLVTKMTTPDMVPAMQRAAAIVTDEGGATCHAAIVSRELGIPCVVGTERATEVLNNGELVTVDATKGFVYRGNVLRRRDEVETAVSSKLVTATLVKVNVAMPEAAERAFKTGADGVGLLRAEHMIASTGKHPCWFLKRGKVEELKDVVKNGIKVVAGLFYPKPVWYRTFDARTDEFRHLEGGEEEPVEDNPMLGWHGIRRALDDKALILAEFAAVRELWKEGYDNVAVMIPFVQHVDELRTAKDLARKAGFRGSLGIMVETPAAAVCIEDFLEEGISFISFGTNDLTQLTLGIDRNNARVQKWFDEMHPAVLSLIEHVIRVAREYDVETSICGQAGSRPEVVRRLVRMGIDSVSANIDAVPKIREVVYREERRIILNSARKNL